MTIIIKETGSNNIVSVHEESISYELAVSTVSDLNNFALDESLRAFIQN